MTRTALLTALALLAAPLAGCLAANGSAPEGTIPFDTIDQGDNSGIDDRRTLLIDNQADWSALWSEHDPDEEPPIVNFDASMVLAIFKGQSNNGCHGAEILNVTGQPDGSILVEGEFYEDTGVACTEQITHPYHIVKIDRYDAPATFQIDDTQRPAEDDARTFQTLDQGQQSAISDRTERVIRDQAAWEALWANHTANREPTPDRPPVDFNESIVIAIFKGQSPDGCHNAEITNLTQNEETLTVHGAYYKIEGQACHQAQTQPFHLIETDSHEGLVDFAIEEETRTA